MKRVILVSLFVMGPMLSEAQSGNPYVSQGIIRPLLPEEFREPGVASFNLGNSGSSPLLFDLTNPDNNLSVTISLSDGVPDKRNPLSSLKGPGVSYFEWSYDEIANSLKGIQKKDIPGYFQTSLSVGYKVDRNSPIEAASNGFRIAIKAPAYLGGSNTTQDDAVSSFTATRAFNFGDAPESYGTARHEINLNKDPVNNDYNRYILLGNLVNHDVAPVFTPVASQNEIKGNDDDGIVFPLLSVGNTYIFPVTVTVHGASFGLLNAWFDWNNDGDFLDSGEKVNAVPIPVYVSGTIPMQVAIPDHAVHDRYTFARFRIGSNSGPVGDNLWGEVEDYAVFIHSSELIARTDVTNPSAYGELSGTIDLQVTGGKLPYTFEWNNGASSEDLANLGPGLYEVTVRDAANKTVTASATIDWPAKASKLKVSIESFKITVYPNPVVDDYFVDISREGKYRIELFNSAGSVVFNRIVEIASENRNVIMLSRGNLVSGPYIMRISGIDREFSQNIKINMMQLR